MTDLKNGSSLNEDGLTNVSACDQPLSLMRIRTNLGARNQADPDDDLLTIRILETSEKKMQLIQTLLSQGDFKGSLQRLKARDISSGGARTKAAELSDPDRGNSVVQFFEEDHRPLRMIDKHLSRSMNNIKLSNTNPHEQISKKREAIKFFHDPGDVAPRQQGDNIAIELRSGFHPGLTEFIAQKQKDLLKYEHIGWRHQLMNLLHKLGLSYPPDDPSEIDAFCTFHRNLNCSPFASWCNLLTVRNRLKAENHIDKIRLKPIDHIQERKIKVQAFLANDSKLKNTKSILTSEFDPTSSVGPQIYAPVNHLKVLENPTPRLLSTLGRSGYSTSKSSERDNDSTTIELSLDTLKILKHPSFLLEETTAIKLLQLHPIYEASCNICDQVGLRLLKLLNSLKLLDTEVTIPSEIVECIELLLKLRYQMIINRSEIISFYNAIRSFREEQGFEATSLKIEQIEPQQKVEELRQIAETLVSGQVSDEMNILTRLIDDISASGETDRIVLARENVETRNSRLKKLPASENKRRRSIREWVEALDVRIRLNDRVSPRNPMKLPAECDTSDNLVPVVTIRSLENSQEVDLDIGIEIFSRPSRHVPFFARSLKSCSKKLTLNDTGLHVVDLSLNDDEIQVRAEFSISKVETPKDMKPKTSSRFSHVQLIDYVFKDSIRMKAIGSLETLESKVGVLLNKLDSRYLIFLLSDPEKPKFPRSFALDPLTVEFRRSLRGKDHNLSLRQNLLIWRWLNNLNQLVHLTKGENVKRYSSQLGLDLNPEILASSSRILTGYQLFEYIRMRAIEYIKRYELHLKESLEFHTRKFDNGYIRYQDLMREHQMNIDLTGLIRVIRCLAPRFTSRRPLMPNRRAAIKSTAITGKSLDRVEDIENLIDWNQSGVGDISSQINLVVTIQHASNLPMRVSHSLIQPSTRSNSPFIASPSPMTSLMRSQDVFSPTGVRTSTSIHLSPPTTYVEVVFQRKQSTTSLVHGKNPTWNETLFIPVDLKLSKADNAVSQASVELNGTLPSSLLDEFLQLNLYDYYCYLENENGEQISYNYEPSTMNLVPSDSHEIFSESLNLSTEAQRLSASRQRIERHLLGSLRVPLSTLLSSSKIEGSFALNQPLFLDNYQHESTHAASLLGRPFSPLGLSDHRDPLDPFRSDETQISVFVTLDPPISMQIFMQFPLGTHETDQVFEYTKLWERVARRHRYLVGSQSRNSAGTSIGPRSSRSSWPRIKKNLNSRPSRHIKALVLQRGCKYCLITRLIGPIEPPVSLVRPTDVRTSMMTLARFVSLMNPTKKGQFSLRHLDSCVLFDSRQLIEENLGGPEEKAVLLCNFFLQLGQCSAILMGDSIPEGSCVYVIVWHEQTNFLQDQLQLQASALLDPTSSSPIISGISHPIDQRDFISRLPVLMSATHAELWDPMSGRRYSLVEPSPLISVGSIVTPENVYANIQLTDNVSETSFDIRMKNLWFPLFESGQTHSGSTSRTVKMRVTQSLRDKTNWRAQVAHVEALRRKVGRPNIAPILNPGTKIVYREVDGRQSEILRDQIERAVKAQLLKWRHDRPTYFNRTLSRKLADRLSSLEDYMTSMKEFRSNDWRFELANLIKNEILVPHMAAGGVNARQLVSWPVNIAFTTMKTILDSLYASSVHSSDLILDSNHSSSLNTEFIVACHIHGYPARVMSVWLYVAALVPVSARHYDPKVRAL